MANLATSIYLQISQYALVEYIYASEIIPTSKARTLRLYNNYSNEYQFFNNTAANKLTRNILDNSAVRLGRESTLWGYLDMDAVTPIVEIDPNLELVDITRSMPSNVKYDRVKLHLLSGYDFAGIDGIILQLNWNEWNNSGTGGRNFTPAAQVYVKGEERIQFSTAPLFVGDRLFDRYIEFALPSLAEANFDFWITPEVSRSFGYQYTFDNVGFSKESLITATLWEIDSTNFERNGNRYFVTGNNYTATFNSADQYAALSAVIQESQEYDYIEYYPTWNGEFLEDYINLLNSGGGDWTVVNQLDLYEQLGSTFVKTFSMTSLQDSALNAPATFRPVVRNAALAISYTVDYVMRLLNKANGQEIIRRATLTSDNPKKYGPIIQRINVLEGFRPVKVYNKIINASSSTIKESVLYAGMGGPQKVIERVYVNSYYDVNYIAVDSISGNELTEIMGEIVYPQGENYIFITKFDNYVKFKVFTKSADKKRHVNLDLSSTGMNIKLAFILDDQSKTYIDPTPDITAADPGAGEVLFRLDDSLTTKLLTQKQKEYYLVNKNDRGDEVLIYTGKYADAKERPTIKETTSKTVMTQLDTKLNTLKTLRDTIAGGKSVIGRNTAIVNPQNTSPTADVVSISQAEQIANAQNSQTKLSAAAVGIKSAINSAIESGDISKLNIPDVPGVTPPMGTNISNAMTPAVIKPSSPSTAISPEDVTSSALTGTMVPPPSTPAPTQGSVLVTSTTVRPAVGGGGEGGGSTNNWTVKKGTTTVGTITSQAAATYAVNDDYPYNDGTQTVYVVSSKNPTSKTLTITKKRSGGN